MIFRGAGDRLLALGEDFKNPDDNLYVQSEGFYKLLATVLSFPFPTVCLINGHAIGAVCQCKYSFLHFLAIISRFRGLCLSIAPLGCEGWHEHYAKSSTDSN